jgi:DNA polymerase V
VKGTGQKDQLLSQPKTLTLKYTVIMSSVINSKTPSPASAAPLLASFLGNRVCAGFPSHADDLGAQRIDLTQVLITHPQATYFLRARGQSMIDAGIFDNDILVVDRAVKPRHNHVVVANPTFPDILPKEGQTIEVWGVVTSTIKQFPL